MENIVFGDGDDKVDAARYELALKSSQLQHDLELFPDSDRTEIGEKGINLSGGQKQVCVCVCVCVCV